MILVTGGAGFIGANFVLDWIANGDEPVVNLDKLTYAGNLHNLDSVQGNPATSSCRATLATPPARTPAGRAPAPCHRQLRGRIACGPLHPRPRRLHPDQRRRHFPAFRGCKAILASAASYQKEAFRFLHVSTDEVYGTLSATDPAFSEDNRYEPNSPYSASKAASDHLVRAWHHTYGLPVLTTNCSNNYGPLHFPEKLIPS